MTDAVTEQEGLDELELAQNDASAGAGPDVGTDVDPDPAPAPDADSRTIDTQRSAQHAARDAHTKADGDGGGRGGSGA